MATNDVKKALRTIASITIFFVLVLLLVSVTVRQCEKEVAEKGGIRGMVISAGKTWKEIKQEIDKEDSDGKNTDR